MADQDRYLLLRRLFTWSRAHGRTMLCRRNRWTGVLMSKGHSKKTCPQSEPLSTGQAMIDACDGRASGIMTGPTLSDGVERGPGTQVPPLHPMRREPSQLFASRVLRLSTRNPPVGAEWAERRPLLGSLPLRRFPSGAGAHRSECSLGAPQSLGALGSNISVLKASACSLGC